MPIGNPFCQTIFDTDQTLSLYEATCRGNYELATKRTSFESFVDSESNVLAVKMEDVWSHGGHKGTYIQEITLAREIDFELGKPEIFHKDGIMYIEYLFPDKFKYVMAVLLDGAEHGNMEIYPEYIKTGVVLDYGKKEKQCYYIYLAAATSLESKEPEKLAKELLLKAKKKKYEPLKKQHASWWRKFWKKSEISLGNKFLESIWYYSLYQFASTSRGGTAPGLFGLWNASKNPPWHGDYHGDINMAMTYWHIFSSNHIELGEPFFQTFEKIKETAIKQTRKFYGIEGLKFPMATFDRGVEICCGKYRLIQCTTGFYALLFWNWYLYTQDKKILKENVFSILEESSKFYLGLVEEKGDSFILGPSWAPEQGPLPAWNVTNDLGLLKPLWQAYVEACVVLGIESSWKEQVVFYLERFPGYPVKNGEFLDSETAGDFIEMNHPGHLAMVYPGNDIDSEAKLFGVAKNTLHNYLRKRTIRKSFSDRISSACDLSWCWLLNIAVRLRDTEYAEYILMDIGIREYLKTNGMFAFLGGGEFRSRKEKRKAYQVKGMVATHALFSLSSTKRGKELAMSMVQSSSAYITAINEMLTQSHKGIIRIFPAVIKSIGQNCSFHCLRAAGGFLVSAEMNNGKTVAVEIKSECGGKCRLKIYHINCSNLKFNSNDGTLVETSKVTENMWEFNTEKGGTYTWSAGVGGIPVKVRPGNYAREFVIKGDTVSYGKKGHLYES